MPASHAHDNDNDANNNGDEQQVSEGMEEEH